MPLSTGDQIIRSLAGTTRRLNVMTDADDFLYLPNGIAFRIMRNASGAREVRITRDDSGLYRLEIGRISNLDFHAKVDRSGLTTAELRTVFEQTTELYLSLGI